MSKKKSKANKKIPKKIKMSFDNFAKICNLIEKIDNPKFQMDAAICALGYAITSNYSPEDHEKVANIALANLKDCIKRVNKTMNRTQTIHPETGHA